MNAGHVLVPPQGAQETFHCVSRLQDVCTDILAVYARDFAGRGRGGWRAVGEILGVSGGTAHEIAYEHRPVTQEQALRWQVYKANIEGNNPNVRIVQTITCPSCGQLHQVPDCHGQAGEVAIVPAGALPSPNGKPKPQHKQPDYWRPCLSPDLKGDMTNEDVEIAISLYRAMKERAQ